MSSSQSRRASWVLGVIAFFFGAFLFQSSLPGGVQAEPEKDKPKHSDDKEKQDHGKFPCDEGAKGGGQGLCIKHKMGTWVGDSQNFPNCQANPNPPYSWVCNSPGAACSDVYTQSGHCTMTGSGTTCNCQCW